jgi:integrase
VRDEMVRSGLSRTTVNARVNRIRRVFRWAASVELVPVTVAEALKPVAGLMLWRSDAPESRPVEPVPVEHVEATLRFLSRPVAAMVRLQLLLGCRTEEILTMRGRDLALGEPNWVYRPRSHKNAWRGQGRFVVLGPRARAIVREFLKEDPEAYLFSPREAIGALHQRRGTARASKPTPSELARRRGGERGRRHGLRYGRRSYRQAIIRACGRASVPEWTPLQLRQTAATLIRNKFGVEAAQLILGHAQVDTTELYTAKDLARAHAIMGEVG